MSDLQLVFELNKNRIKYLTTETDRDIEREERRGSNHTSRDLFINRSIRYVCKVNFLIISKWPHAKQIYAWNNLNLSERIIKGPKRYSIFVGSCLSVKCYPVLDMLLFEFRIIDN